MSFPSSSSARLQTTLGLLALLACVSLGCSETKRERKTAATTGFEAADDAANTSTSAKSESGLDATAVARRGATGESGVREADRASTASLDRGIGERASSPAETSSVKEGQASGKSSEKSPRQPDPVSAAALENFSVPEGSTDDLLSFLQQLERILQSGKFPGAGQEEQKANAARILEARAKAGWKLLDSDLPDEERGTMVSVVLSSLQALGELGGRDVTERMGAFAVRLASDKNGEIARQGKIMVVGFLAETSLNKKPFDGAPFLAALKELLKDPDLGSEAFAITVQAAQSLHEHNQAATAAIAYRQIGSAFRNAGDPQLEEQAELILVQAEIIESGLEEHIQDLMSKKEKAGEAVLTAVNKLLSAPEKHAALLATLLRAAEHIERKDNWEVAGKMFKAMADGFSKSTNAKLSADSATAFTQHSMRASLMGSVFVLEGVLANGAPLDASQYAGKPVFVFFWSIEKPESLKDIQNLAAIHGKYRSHDLEVVGVCVDKNIRAAQQAIGRARFPWENVYGSAKDRAAMANAAGVEALPFSLILDRKGKVVAVHATGRELETKVKLALGIQPAAPQEGGQVPSGEGTQQENAAPSGKNVPAGERSTTGKKQEQGAWKIWPSLGRGWDRLAASIVERSAGRTEFVVDQGEGSSQGELRDANDAASPRKDRAASEAGPTEAEKLAESINPYAAEANLSPAELADFILDMRDKPRAIQKREGFVDAIVDAADRILKCADAKERYHLIAAEAKFEILHRQACDDDEAAQTRLMAFVSEMEKDTRPAISGEVVFLKLEARLLTVEKMKLEELPALLEEVKQFSLREKLGERHLRLASYAVKGVNRLEKEEERERFFLELGKAFSQSEFRRLARYGKKLMTPPDGGELVGQPLELVGQTSDGEEFNWAAYRGKLVVVDFWATWCGPCVAELPNLKKAHEKYAARGFDVVGVSLDRDDDALAEFLEENKLPWTTLAGEKNGELAERYGVAGIPTLFLVDRQGKIVAQGHSIRDLTPRIETLLDEAKK